MESTNPKENIEQYLYERDYENKVCLECKSPKPEYASINNSILICSKCKDSHIKLGYNISYIRRINDEWDPYILNYLERGGNSRFIRLSKKYNLDNLSIEEKYTSRICEYYRLLLKSEVLCDEPPNEIDNNLIYQKCDLSIIYFPEFENYKIFIGENMPELNNKMSLINIFRAIGNGLNNSKNYIGQKIIEHDIKNKVLNGGIGLFNGIVGATKYIFKASKPFVKYITIKSCQGIGYLSNKVVDNLKDESVDNDNTIGNNFFCVNDYVFNQSNEFPTFDEITKGQDKVVNINQGCSNGNNNILNNEVNNNFNNGNQFNNFNNQVNNNFNQVNNNFNNNNIGNYGNIKQENFNDNENKDNNNNNINQNNNDDNNFNIIKEDDYIIHNPLGMEKDKNVNVFNENEKNK